MDFKVFLSNEALSDLEGVVTYFAPHNPSAAARMGNHLVRIWHAARGFPQIPREVK